MKISIIMPAYNEEKRIGKTLEQYASFFDKIKKRKIMDYEILVVINNTRDKTEEIVKEYRDKYKEIKYLNFKEGGKGFAIKEGFKDALKRDNDFIGFTDADASTSAEEFYKLIEELKKSEVVIASRYVKGAITNPKQSINRIIASRGFNFLVRVLFSLNIRDTQCGAKIFKREVLENIIKDIGMTQWAFDVDLLHLTKKNKFKIKEFPTVWKDELGSKLNVKRVSIQMFLAIIQLRMLRSPLRRSWKFVDPIASITWRMVK